MTIFENCVCVSLNPLRAVSFHRKPDQIRKTARKTEEKMNKIYWSPNVECALSIEHSRTWQLTSIKLIILNRYALDLAIWYNDTHIIGSFKVDYIEHSSCYFSVVVVVFRLFFSSLDNFYQFHSCYNDTNAESLCFVSYRHHNIPAYSIISHSLCAHSIHFILFFIFPPSFFLYLSMPALYSHSLQYYYLAFAVCRST